MKKLLTWNDAERENIKEHNPNRPQPSGHLPTQRTYFTPCSSVSIVNFEQVNARWEIPDH